MASSKNGGKGAGGEWISTENALLALAACLVFVASFYYFLGQPREHDVRGLRVLSTGDPYTEMKAILGEKVTAIKAVAYPGEDERNSYLTLVTAEIASAFTATGRNASIFAYVPDAKNASEMLIGCLPENGYCTSERVVVQLDGCNCMRIEGGKIYVLYDVEKIKDPRLRTQLRGVFGVVLQA